MIQTIRPRDAFMDEERYLSAPTFQEYLDTVEKNRELWHGVYERASVVDEALPDRLRQEGGLEGRYRVLALSEDWCGDAVNLLPVVARLVEAVPDLVDFRVVERDRNLDIMDEHLTGQSRSIPVVIFLDQDFQECAWWGPRPQELQEWVVTDGLSLDSDERYKEVRRWYARDKGRTTVDELVDLLEGCESRSRAA